jgi:hypothetical protein
MGLSSAAPGGLRSPPFVREKIAERREQKRAEALSERLAVTETWGVMATWILKP